MGLRVDDDDAVVGLIDDRLVARIDRTLMPEVASDRDEDDADDGRQHQYPGKHVAGLAAGGQRRAEGRPEGICRARQAQHAHRAAAGVAQDRDTRGVFARHLGRYAGCGGRFGRD